MKKVVIFLMLCMVIPAWSQEKKEPATGAQEKKEAAAGEMTDATEILKKADEATKAVNSVRYDGTYEGTGDSAAQTAKIEGKVIMDGEQNQQPKRWVYDVKVTMPGSAEVKEYLAASDGENYSLFDKAGKKAYQDIDPAVLGSSRRFILPIVMREFVHPNPFGDEINGQNRELKGTVDVAGEKCYQVLVTYNENEAATWYFSTKDFLPRRSERSQRREGQRFDSRLTITKLEVDPKLDDKTFKPDVPAGFEKIDDFAP